MLPLGTEVEITRIAPDPAGTGDTEVWKWVTTTNATATVTVTHFWRVLVLLYPWWNVYKQMAAAP